jgi:glycosyltransferase involved in cell wall biosynthesis
VLLFGGGPQQAEFETLVPGAEKRVRFLGFVDDIPAAYRSIDLLVVASTRESQSMVLLEAMAAGVPVVATEVGGTPWLLADGAGWLIPPLDGQELVGAVEELRRDPVLRQTLIRNARQRVEQWFDSSTVAREYLQQVYDPALARTLSASRSTES